MKSSERCSTVQHGPTETPRNAKLREKSMDRQPTEYFKDDRDKNQPEKTELREGKESNS